MMAALVAGEKFRLFFNAAYSDSTECASETENSRPSISLTIASGLRLSGCLSLITRFPFLTDS